MTTPLATAWQEIGDLTGPAGMDGATGDPGAPGVSIVDLSIDQGSGDLLVELSTGQTVNAGRAKGESGGGIDFESSVATVGDLPGTAPYGEARYVQADGHLYVWEAADDRPEGVDGWSDVGPIRGEPGAPGSDGAPGADGIDGVSVTGAAINGAGHLILTLSQGGPIDAGVARGQAGQDGADGADGAPGERGTDVLAYPAGSVPSAAAYRVGTIAIGGDGKLLRAIA